MDRFLAGATARIKHRTVPVTAKSPRNVVEGEVIERLVFLAAEVADPLVMDLHILQDLLGLIPVYEGVVH